MHLGLLRTPRGVFGDARGLKRDRRSASPSSFHSGLLLPIVICSRQGAAELDLARAVRELAM
jgi:hypothetical protein